jgi:hypothetical protein
MRFPASDDARQPSSSRRCGREATPRERAAKIGRSAQNSASPLFMRVLSTWIKTESLREGIIEEAGGARNCGERAMENATRCDADQFFSCTLGSTSKKLLIIFPLACRFFLDIVAA